MNKVKSYSEFINKEIVESFGDEKEIFYSFVESFYLSNLITIEERLLLEKEIINPKSYLINENFFDKLKQRYDKAKIVAKDISQQAKDALEKIVDAAKQATEFVVKIKDVLSKSINNILTTGKEKIKGKLKVDENFKNKIKEVYKHDKNAFYQDYKLCKEVYKFYTGLFKTKIIDSITAGLTKFLNSEDKEVAVAENLMYITENNMISKLVDGLTHIPPFIWLHKVQHMGEKGASEVIKGLSFVTQKLGGPEVVLPVMAAIFGIAFEYNVKSLIKHHLIDMTIEYAIPFVGWAIKVIGWTATFIAAVDLIDELTGAHEFREEGMEDLHGEHPKRATVPINNNEES
jgi:hypothetical protein